LNGLVLVLYWAVVCFFLFRLVQLCLEHVISPVVAFAAAVAIVAICLLFSLVNIPMIPWWGQEDPVLKMASWAGMCLLLVVPLVVRLVRVISGTRALRHVDDSVLHQARLDIAANPTNPIPHIKLSELYERQGNIAAAIVEVEAALRKSPSAALRARLNRLRALAR
jgi:hypothetical protein